MTTLLARFIAGAATLLAYNSGCASCDATYDSGVTVTITANSTPLTDGPYLVVADIDGVHEQPSVHYLQWKC